MPNRKKKDEPLQSNGNSTKPLVIRRSDLFRVRCVVCGKVTAARLPREGRYKGDGTFWFPRRHKVEGVDCRGNIEEATVIECHYVV